MRSKSLPVLVLLLPLAIAACDSSQPSYSGANAPPPPASVAPPAAPPQAAPPPAAPAAQTTASAPQAAPAPAVEPGRELKATPQNPRAATAGVIGIAGCDDYVERFQKCLRSGKLPFDQKIPLRKALNQQIREWKTTAMTSKASGLSGTCAAETNKARAQLSQLGCEF